MTRFAIVGMPSHFDPIERLRALEAMDASALKLGAQLHEDQRAAMEAVNAHRDAHNIVKGEITALRNEIKLFGFRFEERLKAYDDAKIAGVADAVDLSAESQQIQNIELNTLLIRRRKYAD